MYLPWVLVVFRVFIGESPLLELVGLVTGHVYYFLRHVYPQQSGIDLLATPALLYRLFPSQRVIAGVSGHVARSAAASRGGAERAAEIPGRYSWGSGRRLGAE